MRKLSKLHKRPVPADDATRQAVAGFGGAIMDLANWLRSLGLERFEAAFRDNDIDQAVLRDLTDDHLREMGLTLGARVKLLKAIAALPKELASDVRGGIPAAALAAQSAERRHVTVMFSDLVGSTALSTQNGSGRFTQTHLGLSDMRNRSGSAVRRFCREIYGRRCADLFRVSGGS